ncbi:hypothetical protein ACFSLT_28945 [Novosphingobium resinovorum]
MSTAVRFRAPALSTFQRRKRHFSQVPGLHETTPLEQIPETGTGIVDVESIVPSRSRSRDTVTEVRSPVPDGCTSTSSIVAVFRQAMEGVKLRESSIVAIASPARPGVT